MAKLYPVDREMVAAWLRANNIDPDDVPLDSGFTEGVNSDGIPVIRYTAFLRQDGRLFLNEDGTGPATEVRESQTVARRPELPAPWMAEHRLTIRVQIESRPGPADPATGERWAEHRKTGLALVACNCGYTTGWIKTTDLPSLSDLTEEHSGT